MEGIVAQRIKSVLEQKQISISAFAKRIGMQQVTCNRQIRGDQAVSLGLIEGFLREFKEISAEWLLRGKGSQNIDAVLESASTYSIDKNDSQDALLWKAKYEAVKECYDSIVAIIGKTTIK